VIPKQIAKIYISPAGELAFSRYFTAAVKGVFQGHVPGFQEVEHIVSQSLAVVKLSKHRSRALRGAVILAAAAIAPRMLTAQTQTAIDNASVDVNNTGTNYSVPAESLYLPSVVNQEDGQADNLEAYMAQAIAARSYMYYTMGSQGFLYDGVDNQVYTGNGSLPDALEQEAVQLTDRIILRYGPSDNNTADDVDSAGLFVAGAVPTASNGLPFGEAAPDNNPDYQSEVTYNRGLAGENVNQAQPPIGSPGFTNYANRGVLSQNGINFLSTYDWNYADMLRYFYGADIHMVVAAPPSMSDLQPALTVESFDVDNGFFGNGVISSSNVNIGSSTSIAHSSTISHSSAPAGTTLAGSQQLDIVKNGAGNFTYYDLSGLGPNSMTQANGAATQGVVGTASTNLGMPAIGDIDYWIEAAPVSGGSFTTSITLTNDSNTASNANNTATSSAQSIIADGQWHEYSFALTGSSFPAGFLNSSDYFSISSIQFSGNDSDTFNLDDVIFDESALPGTGQSLTWNTSGGSGATWDTATSNFQSLGSAAKFSSGANVTFDDSNNGQYAVTLNTTVTPGSVAVNNSSGNYSITGSGSIAGLGSFNKSGSSTLTLSTTNSYTGGTYVNAGKMIVGAAGAIPANSLLWVRSGATLQLNFSSGAATVSSLTLEPNATLDVNNDELVIDYGSQVDPIATIASDIKSGFNGGHWNGPGIISTAAQSKTNGLSYGVGWADGADGVVAHLSSGQIELKYTLLGDANLDGTVNGSDFSILAANFGTGHTNWDQGNFLFSTSVNGSDFSALAANFGQGDSGAGISVSQADIAALDAFAAANGLPMPVIGAVPEPSSDGIIVLSGLGTLALRRRRDDTLIH
jgi:autotransporter-associated beta strand protein